MSDDTPVTGPDTTAETTASSSSADGPLAEELAETLHLIEQKRAAGRAEREQRGITWREPPRKLPEPSDTPPLCRPAVPGRRHRVLPARRATTEGIWDIPGTGSLAPAPRANAGKRSRKRGEKRCARMKRPPASPGSESLGSRCSSSWTRPIAGGIKILIPSRAREKALQQVFNFVEQGTYLQRGLGPTRPVGCGKTSLLVTAYKLVAPRLLEYPAVPASTIQFVSVLDLFDLWRSSFDEDRRTGEPRYAQLYQRFAEARLLILNDLGAERPTEWARGAPQQAD